MLTLGYPQGGILLPWVYLRVLTLFHGYTSGCNTSCYTSLGVTPPGYISLCVYLPVCVTPSLPVCVCYSLPASLCVIPFLPSCVINVHNGEQEGGEGVHNEEREREENVHNEERERGERVFTTENRRGIAGNPATESTLAQGHLIPASPVSLLVGTSTRYTVGR